jgi:hypothetical protein
VKPPPRRDGEQPDDADIRAEAAAEARFKRRPWHKYGGTVPMSGWSAGSWAKAVLWLTLAAPGFLLAFELGKPGDSGRGLLQFVVMGASVAVAAVLAELIWRTIGREGRDLLRMGVWLFPFALVVGLIALQASMESDVTIDSPTLPLERVGWFLLAVVALALVVAGLVRWIAARIDPGVLHKGVRILLACAGVGLGAWYAHARLTRPVSGLEWRILTTPLALPRPATLAAAMRGCAALGADWRLASRIELETRRLDLSRHGSHARFWVGETPTQGAAAVVYAPGESGGRFMPMPATQPQLALCMLDRPSD